MILKVAVVGAGRRGRAHTEAVADLEHQAQVVAVADIDESRTAALVASSAPYAKPFRDASDMLRKTDAEVVFITTPPPLHREQALAAIEAGAHVVLEKPIALNISDAEAIGEAAAKAGRMVHVCHQLRYGPATDQLRALLADQPIALTHIWNYRTAPDIPGNWSRDWGGGHVVEWGIHYLDLCRYLMQTEPVEIYARYVDQVLRGRPSWDNWDAYSLTVQWANGAVCGYASTYALPAELTPSSGLTVIAGNGKAEVNWLDAVWMTPEETKSWSAPRGEGERALATEFFNAIATGDDTGLRQSFDDAMKTHRLVIAANQSAISGKPVRLS
jgi:myo-inositol 2-dehydrogenase/D-chiro-inositol 1-dehydrogenase